MIVVEHQENVPKVQVLLKSASWSQENYNQHFKTKNLCLHVLVLCFCDCHFVQLLFLCWNISGINNTWSESEWSQRRAGLVWNWVGYIFYWESEAAVCLQAGWKTDCIYILQLRGPHHEHRSAASSRWSRFIFTTKHLLDFLLL